MSALGHKRVGASFLRVRSGDRRRAFSFCRALGPKRFRSHDCATLAGNFLQAVLQGVLAGAAAMYFARSIALLGAVRGPVFPSLVPHLCSHRAARTRRSAKGPPVDRPSDSAARLPASRRGLRDVRFPCRALILTYSLIILQTFLFVMSSTEMRPACH
jgi:hypothetical protein